MAANFWESTHRRNWLFSKEELAAMRQRLEDEDPKTVQAFPLPSPRHLNIYFNQQINRLGKRLGARQQPMATAQLYVKRFYTKVEIRYTNPYLLMATAVYLACKMEECPHHIRLVSSEARSLWGEGMDAPKIGECEFSLISEMNSQLIVHQPYRTLKHLQDDFGLTPEESALAWSIINDHYMTDLPLLYPPHIIALTAMLLALVLQPGSTPGAQGAAASGGLAAATSVLAQAHTAQAQARAAALGANSDGSGRSGSVTPSLTPQCSSESQSSQFPGVHPGIQRVYDSGMAKWLAESNIEIEAMVDCTQELIAFYECHEQYNDKHVQEQIKRFLRARNL